MTGEQFPNQMEGRVPRGAAAHRGSPAGPSRSAPAGRLRPHSVKWVDVPQPGHLRPPI